MARGLNHCTFIGNCGADPEVRFTPSGTAVANVNLGVSERWKDRQSGQAQERTEWVRLVMFNKTAEIAQQYVKKGMRLHVSGKMQTRKWQDQSGQDRYSTEIVVNDLIMLDKPVQGQQPQQGGYQQPNNQPPQQQGGNFGAPDPGSFDDFDDEIPF